MQPPVWDGLGGRERAGEENAPRAWDGAWEPSGSEEVVDVEGQVVAGP